MREETPERIAKHYSAMLDSTNLISRGKQPNQSDTEWADSVERNAKHLKIMVVKDFWTDEDMTEVNNAIATYDE